MYFLYTFYKDLSLAKAPTEEPMSDEAKNEAFTRMASIQKNRDTLLHSALKKHGIRTWPMNDKKFEKHKSTIVEISNELDDKNMCILFIVKDDYDAPEKECHVLSNGAWNRYENTTHALRAIYELEEDHTMNVTRLIYDKI